MAVTPLMFRTEVRPGTTVAFPIEVQNLQQNLLTVNFSLDSVTFEDWSYLPHFGVPHAHDCSSWFSMKELNRTVKGSTRETLELTAKIPSVHQGVYWCMARLTPHFQGDSSTIYAQYQIPIILFIGHQPRPDLKLGTPTLTGSPASSQISVPFENNGEGFTVIGANVEMRQVGSNRLVGTFYDADRNLFPGSKRNLFFSPGSLQKGQYVIISKPQAGTRSFSRIMGSYTVSADGIKPTAPGESLEMSPITLDPPAIHVAMPAGAQRSSVVRVFNNSQKSVNVSVQVRALSQNQSGGFELGQDGPKSGLTVVSDPPNLQLDAGRSGAVRLSLTTDKTVTGDVWFGVSAKTEATNEIAEEIYGSISVPGGVPKLELTQLNLKKIGNYPLSIRFSIKNTGTMSLKPIGFAQVLEQGLTPTATLQVPTLGGGGVLPGSVLENEVMLPPNLRPGAYTVDVKYQYGDELFADLTVPVMVPSGKPKGGK